MIGVLVRASSPIARAGLESLLRAHSALRLVLTDSAARKAMDRAAAGQPVVLLVRNPAAEAVADALRAGVKAVLPSELTGPEIVAAIEAAAAGLVVLDAAGIETLLRAPNAVSTSGTEALVEALTPRELEVLQLLAAGLGNKEIASRLAISEHTVKFHVASILLTFTPDTRLITLYKVNSPPST